jgi:hypothetical protein
MTLRTRHISTEVDIHASAERVWSALSDFDGYPKWNPVIQEVSGTLQVGAPLQVFIAAPGLASRRVGVTLLKVEPNQELRWLGRLFMPYLLDGDHSFVLTPMEPGRVLVTQKETFSGLLVPVVSRWLLPNMSAAFEAMNQALKRHVEGERSREG